MLAKRLSFPFSGILLLAIFIRLILMPFLFHPDLKTHYFHANFLSQGVFNIYQFIKVNKNHLGYQDTFNYPPLTYFVLGNWALITKPILGEEFQNWQSNWGETWFTNQFIFRQLFVLKIPYLFFDIAIGLLLFKLVEPQWQRRALAIWFFNPLSLYIIYGLSTFDIIPVFFSLLSLYFYKKEKYFKSGLSLGIGIALKIYPALFLPFFILPLFFQKKIRESFLFTAGSLGIFFLSVVFLFQDFLTITSSGLLTKIFELKVKIIPGFSLPIYPLIYLGTLIHSCYQRNNWQKVNLYLVTILLLLFALIPFHPQWLLWVLPFLIIQISGQMILLLPLILIGLSFMMLVIGFEDRFLTLGILSPIIISIYDSNFLEKTILAAIPKETWQMIAKFLFLTADVIVIWVFYKLARKESINLGNSSISSKIQRFININLLAVFIIIDLLIFTSFILTALIYSSQKYLFFSQTISSKKVEIYQGHDFVYSPSLTINNADTFYLKLKNTSLVNKDKFSFILADKFGNDLRKVDLSGINIGDDEWVKLQFTPASLKAGEWQIVLSSSTADKSQAIQVYTNDSGQPNLKTYQKASFSETTKKLFNDFIYRLIIDRSFLISFSAILIFLLFLLGKDQLQILKKPKFR